MRKNRHFCDGMTRRSFVRAGALAGCGFALPQLLQADTSASRQNSVIMVYLSGGISHQDTFDLKPDAPSEIRGEFQPIPTIVPGIEFCELLPQLATVADKCSIVRSCVGQRDEHSSFQNLTGYTMGEVERTGLPNFGSVISKVQGSTDPLTPPFVDLFTTMQHRPYNSCGAGYLGSSFNQVRANGEDIASMKLRFVESNQFRSRRELLATLDQSQGEFQRPEYAEVSESYRRAFDVLTSSKLVDAMNIELEPEATRLRYSGGSTKPIGDGSPLWNANLLAARRLVEAGVRVVTVAYGFWDTHGNNFSHMRQHLPAFDAGLAALITDLHERGLDQDVTLVVWGEFGRTPKINKNAGRDHWAPVQSVLFSGGGLKSGQIIGSTDKTAAYAETRPVHYRDVLATVYQSMGIDPHQYVRDVTDRPVLILPEESRPIRELF
ncbi:MAG: DUF1501 domain-containing protein [Planctomycetaceae bacterium]